MTDLTIQLLEGALLLAALGFRVHPLHGKVPALGDWPKRASRSAGIIEGWWKELPLANVGLVTGDDGLFVVDIDAAKQGEEHFRALVRQSGSLPASPVVRTGGGGWHLYFRAPFDVPNSRSKVAPGVDIRGVGGQVAAPPSVHHSGNRYVWVQGRSPADLPVPWAPSWLLDAVRPPKPAPVKAYSVPVEGDRLLLIERARRYLARLPPAISGSGGHDATWRATLALVRGFGLEEHEALQLLCEEFNPRCEPPWSERELRHKVRSAAQNSRLETGYLVQRRGAA